MTWWIKHLLYKPEGLSTIPQPHGEGEAIPQNCPLASSHAHMHKAHGQGGGGRGSRMAQQANALATKFNNLSFIPRTHMVEGENLLL